MFNLSPDITHLAEEKISGNTTHQGSFFAVQKDTVRLPDGQTATREFIRHPGAVVIVPVFENGHVLLERQFRYPLQRAFIEFPAGKIEKGEDILGTAQRELLEETGYTAQHWQHLTTIHNAIGYSDERIEIYLARGLQAGQVQLDEGEFVETFVATLDELLDGVRQGTVTDVKTIISAFWLEKLQQKIWQLS